MGGKPQGFGTLHKGDIIRDNIADAAPFPHGLVGIPPDQEEGPAGSGTLVPIPIDRAGREVIPEEPEDERLKGVLPETAADLRRQDCQDSNITFQAVGKSRAEMGRMVTGIGVGEDKPFTPGFFEPLTIGINLSVPV